MIFKKNLYLIAVMVLILLVPSCSNKKPDFQLNIGKVKIIIIDKKIKISNSTITYEYPYPDPASYYFYFILNNPFVSFETEGAKPIENESLIDISQTNNININNFKKFSFFSYKKTSIGFLIGTNSETGRGTTEMLILDTASDDSVKINMDECKTPEWIDSSGRPPIFAEVTFDYIGCNAMLYGGRWRIENVFVYKKNKFRKDEKLFKSICEKRYRESFLSKDDIEFLNVHPYEDGDGPDDYGRKLLDYVYYGVKSGHKKEVVAFLNEKIDKSYREEVDFFIELLSKPSSVSMQDRIYQFLDSVLSWTIPKRRT